jgi:hypothetical protein
VWRDRPISWRTLAIGVWAIVVIAICVRTALVPRTNTCYLCYTEAAGRWVAEGRVYDPDLPRGYDNYRYSPAMAIFFTAFRELPTAFGNVIWRLLGAAAFFGGFAWFLRHLGGPLRELDSRWQAWLWLSMLPLAMGSLNNGQANLLVIGSILAGVTAAHLGRWNVVAICIAIAMLFKIYPLAFGLLLILLFPRALSVRVTIGIGFGLVLPFLLKGATYVCRQYVEWYELLRGDDRSLAQLDLAYQDFHLLLRLAGVHVPWLPNFLMELAAAVAVAGLVLRAKARGVDRAALVAGLLHLACVWMMLFGPATEPATYIVLAPTAACAFVAAFARPSPRWVRVLLGTAMTLCVVRWLLLMFPFGKWVTIGMLPLAAVLIAIERVTWFWNLPGVEQPATSNERGAFGHVGVVAN